MRYVEQFVGYSLNKTSNFELSMELLATIVTMIHWLESDCKQWSLSTRIASKGIEEPRG